MGWNHQPESGSQLCILYLCFTKSHRKNPGEIGGDLTWSVPRSRKGGKRFVGCFILVSFGSGCMGRFINMWRSTFDNLFSQKRCGYRYVRYQILLWPMGVFKKVGLSRCQDFFPPVMAIYNRRYIQRKVVGNLPVLNFFSVFCVGLRPKQDLGTSGEVSHLLGYFGLMAAWDVGDRLFWFKEVTFWFWTFGGW